MSLLGSALRIGRFEWVLLACGLLLLCVSSFLIPDVDPVGLFSGYGLGVLAVVLHLLLLFVTIDWPQNSFLLAYYLGTLFRFILIIALFVVLLLVINTGQISFTLSFIISYIFHSVVDGILINKTFTKKRFQITADQR